MVLWIILLGKRILFITELPDGRKDYTQKDFAGILEEAAVDMLNVIKEKMGVIDNGQHYETLIVGGGGELELLDKVAGRVLEGPVRVYRPDIIGIRDMAFVSSVGMIFICLIVLNILVLMKHLLFYRIFLIQWL